MKSLSIFMSVLLVSASSHGILSWECQAYCWSSSMGPVQMSDQAEHPLKALKTITELCLRDQAEVALQFQPLTVEPFAGSEEATVQNSCKIIDPKVY